jgi:steroid 5-alpha reductase family enzyme
MSWWALLLIGWAAAAVVMTAMWLLQLRTGDAGIVDVAWAAGVGVLSGWFAYGADGLAERRWLVAALALIWAVRLAGYLLVRVFSMAEDGRYTDMREQWGDRTQRNLFWFFQVQASWSVLFAAPMLVASYNPAPLGAWDVAGVAVWVMALGGEALADRQLHRFRSNPENKGKVCKEGLWRYSRHPNYFFEWIHWWAYVLLAVAAPQPWLALIGPAAMLVFLFKITGIPPTEQRALRSRGEAYREYQRTTSVFFPWPPKEEAT